MTDTAIITQKLTKRFGQVTALDRIDLTIREGEVFGILGPNGAGKSTILDLFLGLTSPTDGTIQVLGMDPWMQPIEVRKNVGLLPDSVDVNPGWTGHQHVTFVADAMGVEDSPAKALERVGIVHALDQPAREYSKGMRQRLLLALALVGDPDLLLLDEPSTGVDPEGMERIREIIREQRDRGQTVVFSSHRLRQVEDVVNRVGMIADGKLIDISSVENIKSQATDIVHIEVENPPPINHLTDRDGIFSVHINGTAIEISCLDQAKKTAIDAVEEAGAEILDIRTETRSLEEYFMEFSKDANVTR